MQFFCYVALSQETGCWKKKSTLYIPDTHTDFISINYSYFLPVKFGKMQISLWNSKGISLYFIFSYYKKKQILRVIYTDFVLYHSGRSGDTHLTLHAKSFIRESSTSSLLRGDCSKLNGRWQGPERKSGVGVLSRSFTILTIVKRWEPSTVGFITFHLEVLFLNELEFPLSTLSLTDIFLFH